MKTNNIKEGSASSKPGQKKVQKKEKDSSRGYLVSFVIMLLAIMAVTYLARFGSGATLSADIIIGQTVFNQGVFGDVLVFLSAIIALIFWMVLTGREKKKVLFFIFLNLFYFFISYFLFCGLAVKTGLVNINPFFIVTILALMIVNYISVFIFAVKYINKKRGTYYETVKCFGSSATRKCYIQEAAHKAFVVSQVGTIILWAIFATVLLNGSFALLLFGISLSFYALLYLISYIRLKYLKKISGIDKINKDKEK